MCLIHWDLGEGLEMVRAAIFLAIALVGLG